MIRFGQYSQCFAEIITSAFQERQRSLQHFIQIEDLPQHFSIVDLPSGLIINNNITSKKDLKVAKEVQMTDRPDGQ